MTILKLTITAFDSQENSVSQAEYIEEELYFKDDETKTAFTKCREHMESIRMTRYLGWNDEVYPKYKVTRIYPQ